MKQVVRIYFICQHNRCRSQMSEAFAKHLGGNNVEVYSAGLEKSELDPRTIDIMNEVGLDISSHTSKKIDMKLFVRSNIIVKLCEETREKCPIVPFGIQNVQWNLSDPSGGDLDSYRRTRDEIKEKVTELLKSRGLLSKEVTYG
jgi:arsenate reductase (thioredoxin)